MPKITSPYVLIYASKKSLFDLKGLFVLFLFSFCFFTKGKAQSFALNTPANLNVAGNVEGGFTFADFDGNGMLDAAIGSDNNTGEFLIYLQAPLGTFTLTNTLVLTDFPIDPKARQVTSGDIDNDGDIDLLTTSRAAINIYKNNGAGVFTLWQDTNGVVGANPQLTVTGVTAVEFAGLIDTDGDGILEMIVDNNSSLHQYENDGTGVYTQVPDVTSGFTGAGVFGDYGTTIDYNNDGFVDIVVRRDGIASNPAEADIFQNDGTGFYTPFYGSNFIADDSNKGGVVCADFDNDGDFDIFWTDSSTNNNASVILTQTGIASGNFAITAVTVVDNGGGLSALPNSGNIDGITKGDVNNDGLVDLFLSDTTGGSYLLLNTSSGGTFSFSSNNLGLNTAVGSGAAEFVDIDNDGDLDLYVAVDGGNNQLWENTFANTDYLDVEVLFDNTTVSGGSGTRPALGATVVLTDCAGNVVSGIRDVNSASGHGSQNATTIKFGLPSGAGEFYRVVTSFVDDNGGANRVVVIRNVIPNSLPNQLLTVTNTTPSDPAEFTEISNVVENDPSPLGGGIDGSLVLEGLLATTSYDVDYLDDGVPVAATVVTDANGDLTISGLDEGNYTNITVEFATGCVTTTPASGSLVFDDIDNDGVGDSADLDEYYTACRCKGSKAC